MMRFLKELFSGTVKVKAGMSTDNSRLGALLVLASIILFAGSIIQTVNSFRIESNTYKIESIGRATQPIQMAAGVHNGIDAFVERIDALPGDEVLIQVSFLNVSGYRMDSVAGRVVLPDALEFVSGTTKIFNRTNPNGIYMEDGIADAWVNLGGYSDYDGQGRGAGSVSFRVRVTENHDLFVCGVNTLKITCQIGGYINGVPSTDSFAAYTAIDVVID